MSIEMDLDDLPVSDEAPGASVGATGNPVTLADAWLSFFMAIEPIVAGDVNSKADRQQYRLKAMEVATQLVALGMTRR